MIEGIQGRQGGGEAVIAVAQQARQVEQPADSQGAPPSQPPEQEGHDDSPQHGGGEVPQVVEGAVEHQVGGQGERRAAAEIPVADHEGQVDQDGNSVKQ